MRELTVIIVPSLTGLAVDRNSRPAHRSVLGQSILLLRTTYTLDKRSSDIGTTFW